MPFESHEAINIIFKPDRLYVERMKLLDARVHAVAGDGMVLQFQFRNWRKAILKLLFDPTYLTTVVFGCPK